MTTKTTVACPVYNLNGDSMEDLLGAALAASKAMDRAKEAIRVMAPNGRNFQTQPAGTFERAQDEHRYRLQRMEQIHEEIDEIWNALMEQSDDIERRMRR